MFAIYTHIKKQNKHVRLRLCITLHCLLRALLINLAVRACSKVIARYRNDLSLNKKKVVLFKRNSNLSSTREKITTQCL